MPEHIIEGGESTQATEADIAGLAISTAERTAEPNSDDPDPAPKPKPKPARNSQDIAIAEGRQEDPETETRRQAKPEGGNGADPDVDDAAAAEGSQEAAKLEAEQVESLMQQLKLPRGVKWFKDKQGELKFIVPIDGQKHVANLEELTRGFNLNQVGHARMQQGKDIKTSVQSYFDGIKQNPERLWELADKLGLDTEQLAEQRLQRSVDEAGLSPEEKDQRLRERNAQNIENENKQLKQQLATAEHQRDVNERRTFFNREISAGMEKHGFKKFNPEEQPADGDQKRRILGAALGKMILANQQNRPLNADTAIYLAKQDWKHDVMSVLSELDTQHVLDVMPESIVSAIRKADLARLKGAGTPTAGTTGQRVDLETYDDGYIPPPKRKEQGIDDFFAPLGR